jgi:hypothetical protein
VRNHLDIRFTSPLAAPGAALPCVSGGVSTRMPVIAFGGGWNHPYALARRPMR